jgi:hypothetical protein
MLVQSLHLWHQGGRLPCTMKPVSPCMQHAPCMQQLLERVIYLGGQHLPGQLRAALKLVGELEHGMAAGDHAMGFVQ